MNIEQYTPIQLSKRNVNISQFIALHIEPLLLSLLMLTGTIGSVYLFGQKAIFTDKPSMISGNNNNSPAVASLLVSPEDDMPANSFNSYIKMDGKIYAGKRFYFTFLQDEKASRYVMEMGDGVRLIVTQQDLLYEYEKPGQYIIELKEIKGGLLHLIGTKKVKVR